MKQLEAFQNQLYLNLETFRKNGESMKTPVWFVQDGDTLLVSTIAMSGKAKRVRNNAKVNIAPCTVNGSLLGEWCPALAHELDEAGIHEKINHLLEQKYGEMKKKFDLEMDEEHKKMKRSVLQVNVKG